MRAKGVSWALVFANKAPHVNRGRSSEEFSGYSGSLIQQTGAWWRIVLESHHK